MSIINNMPKAGGISDINGLIKEYYVYAGENIKAGDLVEFVNGIASKGNVYSTSQSTEIVTEKTSRLFEALKISENKVLILYAQGSNYHLYGIVLEIHGSVITKGAATAINTAEHSAGRIVSGNTNCVDTVSASLLQDGRVFVTHSDGTSFHLAGTILIIQGMVIQKTVYKTLGENQSFEASCTSTLTLSNGNVLVLHSYPYSGSFSTTYLRARIFTINGDNITSLISTNVNNYLEGGEAFDGVLLNNDQVFVVHQNDDHYMQCYAFFAQGSAIKTLYENASISFGFNYTTRDTTRLVPLTDNTIFLGYQSSSSVYGVVVTLALTSIKKGTAVLLSGNSASGFMVDRIQTGDIAVFYDSGRAMSVLCSIYDNWVFPYEISFLPFDSGYYASRVRGMCLSNNKILYIPGHNTTIYAQMFDLNPNINMFENQVSEAEYETQVRKLTTGKIEAIAKTRGQGAVVSIEQEFKETDNLFLRIWRSTSSYTEFYANDGTRITASGYKNHTNYPLTSVWNDSTSGCWNSGSVLQAWARIELPRLVKITKMMAYVKPTTESSLQNAKIQGSVNGIDWVDLSLITNFSSTAEIVLNNTNYYKYYQIIANNSVADEFLIYEWQAKEYFVKEQVPSAEHKDKIQVYKPFTGYNLIPDSSFENGQWADANYSTDIYRLGSRSLYFPTGTTIVANIAIPRPIIGHKYYGRRYIKTNGNNAPADCRFEVWGADGANKNWVYAWNQGNYPNWGFDSAIHEITAVDYPETDRTIIRCFNVNTTADTWVDDLLLLDLTDMFGAGQEPTKEWCDDNL